MTKSAIIFLANGFEESEALVPYDILKRASVDVTLAAVGPQLVVESSHGLKVTADILSEKAQSKYDLVVLPGGMPGTKNLQASADVRQIVLNANAEGRLVGAICAAPMILGTLGLLRGKKATCYPGFETFLEGATHERKHVARDGNIITAAGAGAAIFFGLELVSSLFDRDLADKISREIQYTL